MDKTSFHATTILGVRHRGQFVLVGDGQVTVANTVMKHSAVKIRRIEKSNVLAGFAGSAADAFTLFERFEAKLNEYGGILGRASVELAKDWRSDKVLRRLEALLLVGNARDMFVISGGGDVIAPDDGIAAIGSGGNFALCAARALVRGSGEQLAAREIAKISMEIAADICPFTNTRLTFEEIACDE